jgi:MYXO-CTERM domain-containing protein
VHEIATDDARNEVVEVLRAVSIDDARCHLESTAAAAAPSVGVDASKQTKAGGCAGCHAAGATGSLGGVLAAVLAALMVHRRRRSRAVV